MMELNLLEKKVLASKTPKKNGFLRKATNYLMIAVAATWGASLATNVSCSPSPKENPRIVLDEGNDSGEEDNYQGDDDIVEGDDDVAEDCPTRYPHDSKYNVTECQDIGAGWECVNENLWSACGCGEAYFNFLDLPSVIPHASTNPLSEDELMQKLEDAKDMPPINDELSEINLKEKIMRDINIEFLMEGIEDRKLKATKIYQESFQDFTLERLLLKDEFVGEFMVTLYRPNKEGKNPAILYVPGHTEDGTGIGFINSFKNDLRKDYAFASFWHRSLCGENSQEPKITKSLLEKGFDFTGIQAYEIFLVSKYLKYLENIDDDKIGVAGHSVGGADLAVAIRVKPDEFKAFFTDNISEYVDYTTKTMYSDTSAELHLLRNLINNFSTSRVPVLKNNYGETNGALEFFDLYLLKDTNSKENKSENTSSLDSRLRKNYCIGKDSKGNKLNIYFPRSNLAA